LKPVPVDQTAVAVIANQFLIKNCKPGIYATTDALQYSGKDCNDAVMHAIALVTNAHFALERLAPKKEEDIEPTDSKH